ncbi:MAG TPA: iron ABC transporter permease [Acidimicrobiales bacterium]|nr:iron ABC transporter permease [Acidimicrobiales bacterium]
MDRRGPPLRRSGPAGRPGPTSFLASGALLVAPLAFLAVFFVAPIVAILSRGLTDEQGVDLSPLVELVTDPSQRGVAWFTLWQAAVSTVLTVVAAMPMAYVLARLSFPGKAIVRALIVVPFVLPTVVVGVAFLNFLGPNGPVSGVMGTLGVDDVDLRRTVPAVLIAHVFFNYAVIARTVGGTWARLDPAVTEAARTLGASSWRAFRTITLPALGPTVVGASTIVFLFTFTSFGVIKVLGGPQIATIEVEIHRLTTELLDLRAAAALSLLQMLTVVALLAFAYRSPSSKVGAFGTTGRDHDRRPRGGQWWVLGATLSTAAILLVLPVASLVERSFATDDGYGLAFYRSLSTTGRGTTGFVAPTEAIGNSLVFGLAAAGIAMVLGLLVSLAIVSLGSRTGRVADTAFALPLGTSAVTLGFGFLIALDEPPLDLRTSPLLIPAAQALIAMPFVVRTLLPALRGIDPRLREASATLGATPRRTRWEVDVRLMLAPLLVAVGFALAISLGEFGATVFIARADAPTVPVAIFRSLSRPGSLNFGRAMAMSTVLMVLTASVMLLVDRARTADAVGSLA